MEGLWRLSFPSELLLDFLLQNRVLLQLIVIVRQRIIDHRGLSMAVCCCRHTGRTWLEARAEMLQAPVQRGRKRVQPTLVPLILDVDHHVSPAGSHHGPAPPSCLVSPFGGERSASEPCSPFV